MNRQQAVSGRSARWWLLRYQENMPLLAAGPCAIAQRTAEAARGAAAAARPPAAAATAAARHAAPRRRAVSWCGFTPYLSVLSSAIALLCLPSAPLQAPLWRHFLGVPLTAGSPPTFASGLRVVLTLGHRHPAH